MNEIDLAPSLKGITIGMVDAGTLGWGNACFLQNGVLMYIHPLIFVTFGVLMVVHVKVVFAPSSSTITDSIRMYISFAVNMQAYVYYFYMTIT